MLPPCHSHEPSHSHEEHFLWLAIILNSLFISSPPPCQISSTHYRARSPWPSPINDVTWGSNEADLRSQRTERQRLRIGSLNKEHFPKEVGSLCSRPQKKEPEWCEKGADQETSLTREGEEVRNETGGVNRRVLKWNARISPSWHSWKQKRNYFEQLKQIYYFIIQRQRNRGLNSPARFLQHSLGHWEGLPKTK